jgi:protein-tyrosine phosphatase
VTYRIAVVCTGNICRSPMGEVVLSAALRGAGVDAEVSSYGTGSWHVGDRMDDRAADVLTEAGYDATRHRAAQFTRTQVGQHDLVLAMDSSHVAALRHLGVGEQLRLFRDYDPEGTGDVDDPYYGSRRAFERVLAICERTAAALADELALDQVESMDR